jgi:hypothetical protein
MLFPFGEPKRASFHMGAVSFPIDIVFFDGGGVATRIVTAMPGSRDRWSQESCSAVVETAGGFCDGIGFRVGSPAHFIYDQPANTQRELTDEPSRVPPSERYRDRSTPDVSSPDAMVGEDITAGWPEGKGDGFEQDFGYSQLDTEKREHDAPGSGTRMLVGQAQIADPGSFGVAVLEGIARDTMGGGGILWRPEVQDMESAVITGRDIERWLGHINVAGHDLVSRVASSPEGLQSIANVLLLGGVTQLSRVVGDKIALWRKRK